MVAHLESYKYCTFPLSLSLTHSLDPCHRSFFSYFISDMRIRMGFFLSVLASICLFEVGHRSNLPNGFFSAGMWFCPLCFCMHVWNRCFPTHCSFLSLSLPLPIHMFRFFCSVHFQMQNYVHLSDHFPDWIVDCHLVLIFFLLEFLRFNICCLV